MPVSITAMMKAPISVPRIEPASPPMLVLPGEVLVGRDQQRAIAVPGADRLDGAADHLEERIVERQQRDADPRGKRVVIFGAGGAARAIAVELALAAAARIAVVNRSAGRGDELAALLRDRVRVTAEHVPWQGDLDVTADTDIVVNATSFGLYDTEARLPPDVASLEPGMVVADVIGNPPRTRLIRDAGGRAAVGPSTGWACSSPRGPWRSAAGPASTPTWR